MAVVEANQDLANAKVLKLAKLHDKDGSRTIAVLTKLDLMNPGKNVVNILQGEQYAHYAPKRGYVGVVNRNELNNNIESALEEEDNWFKTSDYKYASHWPHCLGSFYGF